MFEFSTDYLSATMRVLTNYKSLAENAMAQVSDDGLFWQYNSESNSISIIVKHRAGNMRSRWTDFLISDGEKSWRNRDREFEMDFNTRHELLEVWSAGWKLVFDVIGALTPSDLGREVYIRGEALTVIDAINRQLAHYASHVGQIIFIGKMIAGEDWKSLSIPKGKSEEYLAGNYKRPS